MLADRATKFSLVATRKRDEPDEQPGQPPKHRVGRPGLAMRRTAKLQGHAGWGAKLAHAAKRAVEHRVDILISEPPSNDVERRRERLDKRLAIASNHLDHRRFAHDELEPQQRIQGASTLWDQQLDPGLRDERDTRRSLFDDARRADHLPVDSTVRQPFEPDSRATFV
ncbi:MAG: hypothetical protein U0269_21405 [Polyangiales bacterium]